jgi:hypothetical protein
MSEPNASDQAKTVTSSWGAGPQLDRAQEAAAAMFGRFAEIRQRVEELKKDFLTAAEIMELADITTELVELVDLMKNFVKSGSAFILRTSELKCCRSTAG